MGERGVGGRGRRGRAEVVGSGPNGLAAAIRLARAGYRVRVFEAAETIGGGTRTAALTLPGFLHDVCATVLPLTAGSPYLSGLPLGQFGLELVQSDAPLAHPLDGGIAVLLDRPVATTAANLGGDGVAYAALLGPLVRGWRGILADVLAPLRVPRHPLPLLRFGIHGVLPAASFARAWFSGEPGRALFAGLAAHSQLSLDQPFTAAFGLVLAILGHAVWWAYCHVPNGSTFDMADRLEAQVERFAPGFRDRILARHVMSPAAFQAYDANYVGGDINGGIQDVRQLFTRPVPRLNPYTTPLRNVYLCSSATPPGGGVHGMCGYYAAEAALRSS